MSIEIAKDIHWVGVVDWDLRHFHGHELSTHRGSSYNSYLICDEKTVLVDTVWAPFTQEFMAQLRQVIDPAKIDIIVANHSEPDHSGALPEVLRHCPNATVVVSKRGAESFPGHYHQDWNFKVVKTGDKLSIGRRELTFIEASMLHWPDSMFTYVAGDNILFPNDAFGQHYATAYRWNDQVDARELFQEALKYYACILAPFSKLVTRKIDELLAMNLPIDKICPSHGVLWRDNPLQIVEHYAQWARQEGLQRVVIIYDTMWQATRKMAEALAAGVLEEGVEYKIYNMAVSDRNDVLTEIFQARGLAVGSCTLNHGLLPSIAPILEDLAGLRFINKTAAAFGSYGWSGESVKVIEERLTKCSFPLAGEGVLAKWQPTGEDLDKCRQLGRQLAAAVKKE